MKKTVQKAPSAPEVAAEAASSKAVIPEAAPTKAASSKPATGKAAATKTAKTVVPAAIPSLRILKVGRCPTVSGKSTLTYHVGCTPGSVIKLRLYGNSGNGFLNQDWIPWTAIQEKLQLQSLFTSQVLHALFRGKSLNSPGFLMAVLKAEGVVKVSTVKRRCYEPVKNSGFLAGIEQLMASSVDLDTDTTAKPEAKPAAKSRSGKPASDSKKPAVAPKKQAGETEATDRAPADVDTSA